MLASVRSCDRTDKKNNPGNMTKIRLWIQYCCLLGSLMHDHHQRVRSAKTLITEAPKRQVQKPLSPAPLPYVFLPLLKKTAGVQVAIVFLQALPTKPTASWTTPDRQAHCLQAFQYTTPTSTLLEGCHRLTWALFGAVKTSLYDDQAQCSTGGRHQ